MLKSASIFTALATLGIAFMGDFKGTATSIVVIVSVRGLSFLGTKVLSSIDSNIGPIINFTSWCLCGISFIKIIKAAQSVFIPIVNAIS